MSKSILVIAAEASSTAYAEQVIAHLRKQDPDIKFFGVGSKAMEKNGFDCLGYAEDMAIVGFVEVVKYYSELKRIFNNIIAEAEKQRPVAVLLLDYPDFNLRLAKKLKAKGHRIFYYISPQVWAWRQSRIHQIRAYVEKVFLLFPFEVDFYKKHNVPFEFVGHPLLDGLNPDLFDQHKIELRRLKYGIKKSEVVLLLMPGSRRHEIERLFEIQLKSAEKLLIKYPQVRLVIACAPTLTKDYLAEKAGNFKSPFIMLQDEPNEMIALADIVLAASGTATLMVGLLEKPMVIMYKMNWLSGHIAMYLTRKMPHFGLPNMVLNELVVPELKQDEVNENRIAAEVEKYLIDENYRFGVIDKLKKIRNYLGFRGASEKVARHLGQVVRESIDKHGS